MHELIPEQFIRATAVFRRLDGCIPMQGMIEKRHPGRVFIDDPQNPTSGFCWTPWGYFYLAGEVNNRAFVGELKTILNDQLLPVSQVLGQSGFILWPDSEAWETRLPDFLLQRSLTKIYRRTFEFDPATFYEGRYARPAPPHGFRLATIDAALLAQQPDLAAEIAAAWKTPEKYLQEGVGVCLLDGETLASACFSIFTARGKAEVSVSTAEPYCRRGFAILTAAAFIDACLKRGLQPNWECFRDNVPSLRLAENLGFKAQGDFPVYYWEESNAYVNI